MFPVSKSQIKMLIFAGASTEELLQGKSFLGPEKKKPSKLSIKPDKLVRPDKLVHTGGFRVASKINKKIMLRCKSSKDEHAEMQINAK